MKNFLDIIVMSDTHGYLPLIEKPFDLMGIAGDISPAHDHYFSYQIEWLFSDFAGWITSLPYKDENSKVVLTWGNHDFAGERINAKQIEELYDKTNHRLVILKNDAYDFKYFTENGEKTLKIFGTPYCKMFGNWAFMISNQKLEQKYSFVPDDCDILLSHDAPDINNLGLISMGDYSGENAGNPVLAKAIIEKKPKYAFCGHIHSGNHNFEQINGTYMANVSFVNEDYHPSHGMFSFQMDRATKEPVNVTTQDEVEVLM